MGPKRGLGRGLDALLPSAPADADATEVAVNEINPAPDQPRRTFPEQALMALAYSVKQHGILQPLVVTKVDQGYQLIAGERRLRASKLAGLETVPVYIRTIEEHTRFELALLENLQREDLTPLEEARAYERLLAETNQTQDGLAKRLGISRAKIAASVRLLSLPTDIAKSLELGDITPGHAKVLVGLAADDQRRLFEAIKAKGLTVREAERWRPGGRKPATREPAPAWIQQLEQSLGTEVTRRGSDRQGSLQIRYHSAEELNALLARLLR